MLARRLGNGTAEPMRHHSYADSDHGGGTEKGSLQIR